MTDLTLQEVSAEIINTNFSEVECAVNSKAGLNGNIAETFQVANAVQATEAVNKGQLDSAIATINSNILNLEVEVDAKASKSYIDSELVTKLDISDATVTKQGNIFNGENQLVMLNSNGQLPPIDGSLLTGISVDATSSTYDMPTLATNSIDTNNDIDFSTGFCWDNTLTKKIISAAMTKQIDATWEVGTNKGGLDTGLKSASTWYHCFSIAKEDGTSDFLFSTSFDSPIMPNGYIYKRRIGSIRTNGSGNVIAFYQKGDYFWWNTLIKDYSFTNPGTSSTLRVVAAPPNTNVLHVFTYSHYNYVAPPEYAVVTSPYQFDVDPTILYDIKYDEYSRNQSIFKIIHVNSSSQIRTRLNFSSSNVTISGTTQGYINIRGIK